MHNISIVESTLSHIRELSKSIRKKDREEAEALGLIPHKALYKAFKHAVLRRTCLLDGSVAAMWGVTGTPLGLTGVPYLVTGDLCEKVSPLKFARIYLKEFEEMKSLFPKLENICPSDYHEAIRLLKLAGFKVSKPKSFGTSSLFRKFEYEQSV